MAYSPPGCKESDSTRLHFHFLQGLGLARKERLEGWERGREGGRKQRECKERKGIQNYIRKEKYLVSAPWAGDAFSPPQMFTDT